MAIMKQESSFIAGAKPPRTKLLGFIPWSRPTTAYGYAQATDGTWRHYQQSTRQSGSRDSFGNAVDFIGWYGYRAHRQLGISRNNAGELYLAYHEGLGGYAKRSYRRKGWLMQVARKVNATARSYRAQLSYCESRIPRPSIWNLWLA